MGRRDTHFEWLAQCMKIVLLTLLLFRIFYGCRCQNASFSLLTQKMHMFF